MTLAQFWYVLVACYLAFLIGFVTVAAALLLLVTRAILRRL